jgi:hypothetical protein
MPTSLAFRKLCFQLLAPTRRLPCLVLVVFNHARLVVLKHIGIKAALRKIGAPQLVILKKRPLLP